MQYSVILAKFLSMFPVYTDQVSNWSPAGSGGIRIGLSDGSELLFTYTSDRVWNLEPIPKKQ